MMTFIVNQQGIVYQRNLGERTVRLGGAMKFYNPEQGWEVVQEPGMTDLMPTRRPEDSRP